MKPSQMSLPIDGLRDITMPTCPITPETKGLSGHLRAVPDRLFVPLAADPFRWFCSGRKNWELRKLGRQYTPVHVRLGRGVELRRGYSDRDAALWGQIIAVVQANSIQAFFAEVPWSSVLPESVSLDDAIAEACRILNITDASGTPVLGFRVRVDGE